MITMTYMLQLQVPEPHVVITGLLRSTPADWNSWCRSSGDRNFLVSGSMQSMKGTL